MAFTTASDVASQDAARAQAESAARLRSELEAAIQARNFSPMLRGSFPQKLLDEVKAELRAAGWDATFTVAGRGGSTLYVELKRA